jgi:hypothetical protein
VYRLQLLVQDSSITFINSHKTEEEKTKERKQCTGPMKITVYRTGGEDRQLPYDLDDSRFGYEDCGLLECGAASL